MSSSPSVKALDTQGQPVAGAVVTFTVSAGGGVVTPTTITTGADGTATVNSWALGKSNVDQGVEASADGGATPIHFDATIITQYSIQLIFVDTFADAEQKAFTDAAARWGAIITNDLQDGSVSRAQLPTSCAGNSDQTPIAVDDLLIFVQVQPIDGVGGKLAASGPCATRTGGPDAGSPAVGIMNFDSADTDFLQQNNLLETTVLHEMGHVIGIGSLWVTAGLLQNPSLPSSPGVDTTFSGSSAMAAFNGIAMGQYSGGVVPVDNTAKLGSADSHWRESVLTTELMSPVLTGKENGVPLSIITIASLTDLGWYDTNTLAADPYVFGQSLVIAEELSTPVITVEDGCQVLYPTMAVPLSPTLTRIR